jgi:hypothetical protein
MSKVSSSYQSDHLSIIGEVKLAARMSKKSKPKHQMPPPDWQALQDKDLHSKFNQAIFEDMIQDLTNFDSIEKSCNILKQASDILPRKSNAKKGWYAFDETNLKQVATNWNHVKTKFEQVLSSKCYNELINQARDRMKLARKMYQQACKTAKQLFTQLAIDRANNKKDANGQMESGRATCLWLHRTSQETS